MDESKAFPRSSGSNTQRIDQSLGALIEQCVSCLEGPCHVRCGLLAKDYCRAAIYIRPELGIKCTYVR